MSNSTPNLNLFKYDVSTDANVAFSITKALNNNWDIIDAKCGQSNNILDFKWSDHLLNDMSWLRTDTFSWQDGTTYSLVYNELLSEYNNSASTTATDGSITFKRTPKGYKITLATQETAIAEKYATDGIAWYYILDTTNKKFKLPRAKHPSLVSLTSTLPVYGNGKALGTNFGLVLGDRGGNEGVSLAGNSLGTAAGVGVGSWASGKYKTLGVTTDPTKSGLVADLSSNVKDYSMYLYFYVGNFTKSAESQTAGLKAELLNGKQDVCIHIIETYINGTSGYRIWSDGYCEQWGYQATNPKTGTVTLPKAYQDTNYCITIGQGNVAGVAAGYSAYATTVAVATSSSFTYGAYDTNAARNFNWKTSGYLG